MPSLSDWAEQQRTYIIVEEGQTILAKFLSYKFKANRFDPEKQVVEYTLELPDGKTKTWDNGNASVANQFGRVKPGQWVKIMRLGTGKATVYSVKPTEAPSVTDYAEETVNPDDVPF